MSEHEAVKPFPWEETTKSRWSALENLFEFITLICCLGGIYAVVAVGVNMSKITKGFEKIDVSFYSELFGGLLCAGLISASISILLRELKTTKIAGKNYILHDGRIAKFVRRVDNDFFFTMQNGKLAFFNQHEVARFFAFKKEKSIKATNDELFVCDVLRRFETRLERFYSLFPLGVCTGLVSYLFSLLIPFATKEIDKGVMSVSIFAVFSLAMLLSAFLSLLLGHIELFSALGLKKLDIDDKQQRFRPQLLLSPAITFQDELGKKQIYQRENFLSQWENPEHRLLVKRDSFIQGLRKLVISIRSTIMKTP